MKFQTRYAKGYDFSNVGENFLAGGSRGQKNRLFRSVKILSHIDEETFWRRAFFSSRLPVTGRSTSFLIVSFLVDPFVDF